MYKAKSIKKDSIMDYAVCPLASCKKSSTCIRHAAYIKAQAEKDIYDILNTSKFTTSDAGCKHYLTPVKLRMARGFKTIYETLPKCNSHYFWTRTFFASETSWYRAKRGDLLLTPDEQNILLEAFRAHGADISVGFDGYVEKEVFIKV